MKTTRLTFTMVLLASAIGAASVNGATFNLQEDGTGDLGSSTRTFSESGISLVISSSGPDLFVNVRGGDEIGLGVAGNDNNEITSTSFIQLKIPTSPGVTLESIGLNSVQLGELANIYFSTTLGTLGSPIGTVTSDGSFSVAGYGPGYIGIAGGGSGGANVLLDAVTVNVIRDGGTTFLLLGMALVGLWFFRSKFPEPG